MRSMVCVLVLVGVSVIARPQQPAPTPPATGAPAAPKAPVFDYQEVMVPMRDGVKLQTVILRPRNAHGPLPILLRRTPYGVPDKAPEEIPANLKELAAELKRACGTGGTVTEGGIELHGDLRDRLREVLAQKGFTVKG